MEVSKRLAGPVFCSAVSGVSWPISPMSAPAANDGLQLREDRIAHIGNRRGNLRTRIAIRKWSFACRAFSTLGRLMVNRDRDPSSRYRTFSSFKAEAVRNYDFSL